MSTAKCLIKLSKASKLCDTLISKEFLVMISLIDEETGLRVSDIHFILGGNKSWVSTLCKNLFYAGLTTRNESGREVFYKLTPHGNVVAKHALDLINSLIKTENMEYLLEKNTFLLDPEALKGKLTQQLNPNFTHEGAVLLNKSEGYFFFIGTDKRGRPLIIDFPLKNLQKVAYKFDTFYKRRYSPRFKPLVLSYSELQNEKILHQKAYFFIDFHLILRTTKNSKWYEILQEELAKIKSSELESEQEVLSTVENIGE